MGAFSPMTAAGAAATSADRVEGRQLERTAAPGAAAPSAGAAAAAAEMLTEDGIAQFARSSHLLLQVRCRACAHGVTTASVDDVTHTSDMYNICPLPPETT
eukprot:51669-Chlamydomonas_euryale.AAC.1